MGLFFNYTKEGPGVDKNAPKKKGIFLYFEILFRKIWKLCQANFLYVVCSLPMILIYYLLVTPFIFNFVQILGQGEAAISSEDVSMYSTMLTLFITVTSVVFMGSGPASASFAYITRCFSREEHAWILTDFFAKFKENFKQGMIVAVIDIIAMVMGGFAIRFYYNYYLNNGQTIWFFLMCVLTICMFLFISMHYYIYQLMVTFENKIKDLYRNALILAMSTFPVNLLFTLLFGAISFVIFTVFTPIMSVILTLVILVGLLRFPFEFYAESVIRKKILINIDNNSSDNEIEEKEDENMIGVDN
ncbi:MAG: DUF624 domain-containing protein [Clostridia bacterium]|nr:DUF624 domain-containing protein [Clostridia bacterium]